MDADLKRAYFKFRDEMHHKWEDFEKGMSDEDIIDTRQAFFTFLMEMFCGWHNKIDCLPEFVKVGAIGNNWIKIEYIENK